LAVITTRKLYTSKIKYELLKIGTWIPDVQKTISFCGVFQLLVASKKQSRGLFRFYFLTYNNLIDTPNKQVFLECHDIVSCIKRKITEVFSELDTVQLQMWPSNI